MENHPVKRIARVKLTLTKRTVEALEPADKPWIAWDDKLTGFGVQPSGTRTFVVNYRAGDGGRKAPNKRVTLGRYGRITPDKARRMAQELLGRVAGGDDPASVRAEARGMPTLGEAFEDYMAANPNRKARTVERYRQNMRINLHGWRNRPLDAITRRDIEGRFNLITEEHGWAGANQTISLLRSIYRRSCVDHEGLRNPVELWLAGGGRYHHKRRRRISAPSEVLARRCGCRRASARAPRHLPGRGLHRHAPGRDRLAQMGAPGTGAAYPAGRGDEDRGAAGASHDPAAGRDLRAPPGRTERTRTAGCSRPP